MKLFLKFALIIMVGMTSALMSCSDDSDYLENSAGSTLEHSGEYRISKFKIESHWLGINGIIDNFKIKLIQLDGASIEEFDAKTAIAKDKLEIAINIPNHKRLNDGKYAMIAFHEGKMIPHRMITHFADEMLVNASLANADYEKHLEGSGSEEEPFEIRFNAGLDTLCKLLYNDDSKAAGLHFKQMTDITLNQQGDASDDWGHANQSFAGNYDGNGKTIDNLTHIGNGTSDYDCNIGLFNTLCNGAVVKNLKIELGTCRGIKENFGAVAGCAKGTITIDDVDVKGSVTGTGKNIGGLIGYAGEYGTVINISDIDIEVGFFDFTENVGGIIGCIENSEITINKVRTFDNSFTFHGKRNIGGIIGYTHNTTANITDCNIEHTTSTSNDNVLISATESNGGGIIGKISASTVNIKNSSVYCPVGGSGEYIGENIGGLIGYQGGVFLTTISKCYVAGKVMGNKNVGGMIGQTDNTITKFTNDSQMATFEETGIGVYGNENIGGIVGYINDSNLELEGTVTSYTNVIGKRQNTGGFAGLVRNSDLNLWNFNQTTQNTMNVTGVDYVGGLVGQITEQSLITSNNDKTADSNTIPSPSEFNPDFSGVVTGANHVGGAVGSVNNSSLSNLCVSATVTGNGTDVGGIAGSLLFASSGEESVYGVKSMGEIKNPNGERTGGVAGSIDGKGSISFSINYAIVGGGKHSGGIVGYTDFKDQAPEIMYNYNVGNVSGYLTAGGIVGHATSNDGIWFEITCCSNFGNISCAGGSGDVNNWWGLGGILGSCDHKKIKITNCSNHGEIKGTSNSFHGVGGIAGVMGNDPGGARESDNLYLYSCANYGNISSTGGWVGGILGFQEEGEEGKNDGNSVVEDCINHGQITDGGGIIGFVDHYSQQRRCINFGKINGGDALVDKEKDGAVTHQHDLYYHVTSGTDSWGESFTSEEQNKQSTFSNFDFTNVWRLDAGDPYPILRNCFGQDAQKP